MNTRFATAAAAVSATLLAAMPAFAHHPMDGAPMTGFGDGLLSGIGHPILGFDHLFFVLLMGVAALFTGQRYLAPAGYIVAMLLGCAAMAAGIGLPAKELVIALSLLVLGGLVLSGRALAFVPALLVFAGFGLFHGSAFGEAVAGQEAGMGSAVLAGYLIGLGAVQYGLALAAGWMAQRLLGAAEARDMPVRLAGAAVAGIGGFLALEGIEGAVIHALGWAA
jgi:urease accessory protein